MLLIYDRFLSQFLAPCLIRRTFHFPSSLCYFFNVFFYFFSLHLNQLSTVNNFLPYHTHTHTHTEYFQDKPPVFRKVINLRKSNTTAPYRSDTDARRGGGGAAASLFRLRLLSIQTVRFVLTVYIQESLILLMHDDFQLAHEKEHIKRRSRGENLRWILWNWQFRKIPCRIEKSKESW